MHAFPDGVGESGQLGRAWVKLGGHVFLGGTSRDQSCPEDLCGVYQVLSELSFFLGCWLGALILVFKHRAFLGKRAAGWDGWKV